MSTLIQEGLRRGGSHLKSQAPQKGRLVEPTTDDELWDFIVENLNIYIPRVQVCPNHCAPFTAVADAFFARSPISVWWASRGFGGKSFNLAALSLTEAILRAKVNLLGGSGEQSERVLNYVYGEEVSGVMLDAPNSPHYLISGGYERGTLKRKTDFIHGGYLRALMASQRSVRGPHPERLRLDEIDEMELAIFDAAMGQTMALRDIPTQTVASSTWHNSDGTMSEILDRAEKRGWPVYSWCYRENLVSNGGWLPDREVGSKRVQVTGVMFDVEYELQEPNPESRAIAPEAVARMFNPEIAEFAGDLDQACIVEKPKADHIYVMGTDWAKRKDWTIILTFRELEPYDAEEFEANINSEGEVWGPPKLRLVRFERTGRHKWPVLVGMMEKVYKLFKKVAHVFSCHDETGVGDVVNDYMTVSSTGVWMAGRLRNEIMTDYIAACEHGFIECPDIAWMKTEHKLASYDDVYGPGSTNHLPDTIAAGALAYHIWKNRPKKLKVRATWGS